MNKKPILKNGYRVLAIVWTLAAAAMAVAFVRRLAEFNLFLLLMTALSTIIAAGSWKTYHRTPEAVSPVDPFDTPPKFADNPVLFDDDPNQDSEEKNHE